MPFFFSKFPSVEFDLQKDGMVKTIQNPLIRFKIRDIIKNRMVVYFDYNIKDGISAQVIADKYYGDASLDWLIYIVNDIYDMSYDWPLTQYTLNEFIRSKYGSIPDAQALRHHYEWTYQAGGILSDGTVVKKRVFEVDALTFASLPIDSKRDVDCYTYENELNEEKRVIKILQKKYINQLVQEIESAVKK
jgi:hypothetical protein